MNWFEYIFGCRHIWEETRRVTTNDCNLNAKAQSIVLQCKKCGDVKVVKI